MTYVATTHKETMKSFKFQKTQPGLRPKNLEESEETSTTGICYCFRNHRCD